MPLYEYRCRVCDTLFTQRRPMSESALAGTCPQGHDGAPRLLSAFAATGAASAPAPAPAPAAPCGAHCACH